MNSKNNIHSILVPGARIRQHIGKLYVITDDIDAYRLLKEQFDSSEQRMALYPFSPVLVQKISDCGDPALFNLISESTGTFFCLIPSPIEGEPLFLTQTVTSGVLAIEAINFAYEVDQRTRAAFKEFAEQRPDLLIDGKSNLLIGAAVGGIIGVVPSIIGSITFTGREKRLSKKEKEEMLESARASFVEDVKAERNNQNPMASKSIDLVINSLPDSTKLLIIRKYLDTLSEEELQQLYDESVDMHKLAKKSQVKIIVRERMADRDNPAHYEDITGTKGDYRICYKYGEEEKDHLFDFTTRAECAVYLCCLMARYEFGDRNLDFADMEEMFIGAFRFIYGESYQTAKATYDMLLDEVDSNGGLMTQGRLKDYISGIRKTIDHELLHKENPCIFYFKKNGHLNMLPQNIILPAGINDAIHQLGKSPSAHR